MANIIHFTADCRDIGYCKCYFRLLLGFSTISVPSYNNSTRCSSILHYSNLFIFLAIFPGIFNLFIMNDEETTAICLREDDARGDNTTIAPFSCHQCRKSKLKCDRTRPCCGRCLKQNYECIYSNSRQPYRARNRGQAKELEAKLGKLWLYLGR